MRFVPQSVQTVSATIGKDSLRAGLLAGIGGIIVVHDLHAAVLPGSWPWSCWSVWVSAAPSSTPSWPSSVRASNLTLTLAGVTGIIVSVGITVDSYIVFFERLKDEVRAGRTVRQSVERSFSRAFRTVLTADLVSFLAALILYLFTVGDVRGLRLHSRPVHRARRVRSLVLHPTGGHPDRPPPELRRQPGVRYRPRPGRPDRHQGGLRWLAAPTLSCVSSAARLPSTSSGAGSGGSPSRRW